MDSLPLSYFTDNLWKKQPKSNSFVELIYEFPEELYKKMASHMSHRFLNKEFKPVKNDQVATDFRVQGNEYFKKRNWRAAMEFYNQSLRFSNDGSENISLAYANRSSCFLHMEKYIECLKDIELAKENGYPKRLIQKLNDREIVCLKQINEGYESIKKNPSRV